ncbi:MAG: cysteine--tRNA ligase [Patescibacteria group bacterium]
MPLKFFNTKTRRAGNFKALKKTVGLYTCGPTVYNYAHIGNLRTYIFEDLLKRTLLGANFRVKHVMNITDVGHLTDDADLGEDKMEKGARREGKSAWDIAKFYTKEFQKDLKALNILPPDVWCRATDHIKEQIALIRTLERKGYTYLTSDGVYFDTKKFRAYGVLVGKEGLRGLQEGARVEKHPEKRNATDFALWKFSPAGQKRQMEWLSPWGVGFPGWHIECSAMSMKYLGATFDIHCGGIDHIQIHHTNEIAQSESATGKPFARYWLHGEFLTIDDGRMGKSEGNFIPLHLVIERGINPFAYRYLLLQTHYRKQLSFSWEALDAAEQGYRNLIARVAALGSGSRISAAESGMTKDVKNAFEDDLNAPEALAALWKALKSATPPSQKTIFALDAWFGLALKKSVAALNKKTRVPAAIKKLLSERETARAEKKWLLADQLREKMLKAGWQIDDSPTGSTVHKD